MSSSTCRVLGPTGVDVGRDAGVGDQVLITAVSGRRLVGQVINSAPRDPPRSDSLLEAATLSAHRARSRGSGGHGALGRGSVGAR